MKIKKTNEKYIYFELHRNGTKKGTYQVFIQIISPLSNHRVQRKVRGIINKEKAKQIRDKCMAEIKDEITGKNNSYTWDSWFEKYLEIRRPGVKKSTMNNYLTLKKITKGAFGNKPISKITPNECYDYLYSLDVVSEKRRKRICTNMKTIFTWAVDEGVIARNPMRKISIEVEETEQLALNSTEVQVLLNEAKRQKIEWYPIWVMALYTGLRSGELLALLKTDIDLQTGFIKVTKSLSKIDGVKPTKTKRNRVIPISKELRPFLQELILNIDSEYLLPRIKKWENNEQAKYLKLFCNNIDITPVKFKDLRATVLTNLLTVGRSINEVMAVAGHASLKTTDRYVRRSGIQLKGVTDSLSYNIPTDNRTDYSEYGDNIIPLASRR